MPVLARSRPGVTALASSSGSQTGSSSSVHVLVLQQFPGQSNHQQQGIPAAFPAPRAQLHAHLCAMLKLKFVKESPGVPQVRINLHCSVEPLSGLGYFTLAPE